MRFATQAERDQCWSKASRMVGVAPRCHCGLWMNLDTFNGMFYCREQGHGGYQTQEQVVHMHYDEMIRDIEGGAS